MTESYLVRANLSFEAKFNNSQGQTVLMKFAGFDTPLPYFSVIKGEIRVPHHTAGVEGDRNYYGKQIMRILGMALALATVEAYKNKLVGLDTIQSITRHLVGETKLRRHTLLYTPTLQFIDQLTKQLFEMPRLDTIHVIPPKNNSVEPDPIDFIQTPFPLPELPLDLIPELQDVEITFSTLDVGPDEVFANPNCIELRPMHHWAPSNQL